MSRNVVTLVPRWRVLPRRREQQDRVTDALGRRYRLRTVAEPERIEIDFPKSKGRRAAKDEVVSELDRVSRGWRRLFRIYPAEQALK